jgi:hypothetical protein
MISNTNQTRREWCAAHTDENWSRDIDMFVGIAIPIRLLASVHTDVYASNMHNKAMEIRGGLFLQYVRVVRL